MKKASNGSGTLEYRNGLWWLQILRPLEPGETKRRRARIPVDGSEKMTEAQARRASVRVAADFRAGKIVFGPTQRPAPVAGPAADWRTVRQLGDAWTSGAMFERFGKVAKLRIKAGAKIDKWTLEAHVYDVKTRGEAGPCFGDLDVSAVTSDDITKVMGAQPAEQRAETRIKQYNRLHRLFELAEFPCKLRPEGTNPVKKYLRPELDADKLYSFLFPDEALALLRGTDATGKTVIPLARRIVYALAIYTGQRKGSLFAMRWKHVGFDRGTLASFRTKTGAAQYFVADPGLMGVLKAWHELRGKPGTDEAIVPPELIECEVKRLATALRDDLRAVGVTRAILFETDEANVQELRFHDARATFCTWARRAGKSDAWISERTGQKETGKMIDRYDRGAQTLADLEYAPFPDISGAIPELQLPPSLPLLPGSSDEAATDSLNDSGDLSSRRERGRTADPYRVKPLESVGGVASSENPVAVSMPMGAPQCVATAPQQAGGNARGNAEPTEAELERGILDAVRLGLADVARTLSAQLEARRTPANVVPIRRRR